MPPADMNRNPPVRVDAPRLDASRKDLGFRITDVGTTCVNDLCYQGRDIPVQFLPTAPKPAFL